MAGEAYKAAGAVLLSHLVKDQASTFVVINFVVSIYALSAVLTKVILKQPSKQRPRSIQPREQY